MNEKDPEKFVWLFSRSQLQILGFIQLFVPSTAEAEDILQETSVVLWTKWSQFDQSRDFANWACGIARYEVFKYLRKNKRNIYLSEELLQRISDVALKDQRSREDDRQRQAALALCFESQPAADQHLLTQRYREEKSVAEIAIERSVTPRAVYKQLSQIREFLQRCIERRVQGMTT